MNKFLKLNLSKFITLSTEEAAHVKGGRRVTKTYESAIREFNRLLKNGYSPSMHKMSDGTYCIDW